MSENEVLSVCNCIEIDITTLDVSLAFFCRLNLHISPKLESHQANRYTRPAAYMFEVHHYDFFPTCNTHQIHVRLVVQDGRLDRLDSMF